MILYHGTDDKNGAKAFLEHNLRGNIYFNENDQNISHEVFDFSDEYTIENVVYLTSEYETALHYAKYAVIAVEVDPELIHQISDVEYIMPADADYEVLEVKEVDGSLFTMERIGGIR